MTLSENGRSSEITSFKPLGSEVASAIGSQRGALGVGKPLPASAALASLSPTETDRRLVDALERISGQRIAFRKQRLFPNIGPTYSIVVGIDWPLPASLAGDALDLIEGSFKAAPEDRIAAEVYRLRMLTRGRDQRDAADQEAEATIWIEQLRGYPGDVVLHVLRTWPSRENGSWWPTWAEIERELRKAVEERLALAKHVEAIARRGATPEPAAQLEDHRPRPTIEELKDRLGETWGIVQEVAGSRGVRLSADQERDLANKSLAEMARSAGSAASDEEFKRLMASIPDAKPRKAA